MKCIKYFLTVTLAVLLFTACSDDDSDMVVKTTTATINLLDPSETTKITDFTDVSITFTELNTQQTIEQKVTSNPFTIQLNQGSYEISVSGAIVYSAEGEDQEGNVGGFVSELNFVIDEQSEDIQLSLKSFSNDFIIEEVFFTGYTTPEGGFYYGDQYFKLYNNTDEVLYADGIILAQSKFLTVDKQDYTPNLMSEAFTTAAMVQIPGSGNDHPVQPGESIIIAYDGINHIEQNTNSLDLSNADFEFFYEDAGDIDNPSVTNLINFYDKIFPHTRGFNSYVIARLPEGVSKEAYLQDYLYDYKWLFVFGEYEIPREKSAYKIPNEWVIDAVNMSVESEFQWIVTDSSLDNSYTYCGKTDKDASRFGKSVKRKVLQEIDGIRLLQDTNDSAVDFIPEATPSLAE